MWMMATVHAYDVMGYVHITASLSQADTSGGTPTAPVLHCTTTIPGTGETDARRWLEDVLVGLLETL